MTAEPIAPIRHTRLRGGLFTSAGPLTGLPNGRDWRSGVNFTPSCGGAVQTWACDTPYPEKTATDSAEAVRFDTFLIYAEVRCDGGFGREQIQELAQLDIDKGDSAALARELHGNESGNGNPSLQSTAVDKSIDAGPQSLANSLQALVGVACECNIGDLMFHAPIWTLPEWEKNDLVEWDGTRYRLGEFTVSFDCYPNIGPDESEVYGPNDAPADGSGEAWIYVSGSVEREVGQTMRDITLNQRINENVAIAERLAILRFDPCCVAAVKASVC